ncbi:hypothetical protein PEQA60_22400 [Pseudomonas sp. Eqa60]|uniref:DUF2612 domain-containing protein n=1 Tax=Pseudomonas sp. Eqa60 TaxID=2799184 RepID=UPI001BB383FA|nr:DUF2612 domain-containing protein [Pseudomonas sp. Eqa60]BCQ68250.1 hypothetical protein PEQA60_22400 [Pseudomonas sp. Eqa60]
MNIPDRIYAQYRDKPKAVAWYEIAKKLGGSIEAAAQAVRKSYDIDTAVGEELNVIGRIVVAPRSFVGSMPMNPGLFDLTDGDEFGDDEAMFSALTIDQDGQLSDELYRLVIKAKIIKNNGDATIENILDGMNFLLPKAEVLRVTDGEDMSFSIEFYGQISNLERFALLNAGLVPKPQAVRFSGFLEGFEMVEFGDLDAEFGDEEAEFSGYIGA